MHYETLICEKCGVEYGGRSGVKNLCKKCRAKEYYATTTIVCGQCGKEFIGRPDLLYCSSCAVRSRKIGTRAAIKCAKCGNNMTSHYGETECEACRRRKRRRHKVCKQCGKEFESDSKTLLCEHCRRYGNSVESTCVVCGKKFFPKRINEQCKTCSRTCQGYYIQQQGYGMKYRDDELLARIRQSVAENGIPLSIEDLGKSIGGVTHKVFSARGWTIKTLMKDICPGYTHIPGDMSLFEIAVYDILKDIFGEENIETQKRFPDCKKKNPLRFDFYIQKYNLVVEADGAQHYKNLPFLNSGAARSSDVIKNEYCLHKGIGLLRIRYEKHQTTKELIKKAILSILPPDGEIRPVHCFNCWDGSKLIPISSQASNVEEGSQTIPRGSTPKPWVEMGSTLTNNVEGEDIVGSAGKS